MVRQTVRLLTGFDWPFAPRYGQGFADEDEERAAWEAHRDELLEYWSRDPGIGMRPGDGFLEPAPGGPGTRPRAWWKFEAPDDERRPVRVEFTPEYETMMRNTCRGFTRKPDRLEEMMEEERAERWEESEPAFLRRHGLLTEEEVERLREADYDPVRRHEDGGCSRRRRLDGEPRRVASWSYLTEEEA